jgi:hypothetical protein
LKRYIERAVFCAAGRQAFGSADLPHQQSVHHPTCRRVGAGGNWSQQAKLTSDRPKISGFDFALSLKTSALVIGVPNSVVSGKASQGAAFLFSRTGNIWNKQTEFMIFDGALQDRFGNSVVQDGSLIIVGTPQKMSTFTISLTRHYMATFTSSQAFPMTACRRSWACRSRAKNFWSPAPLHPFIFDSASFRFAPKEGDCAEKAATRL